MSLTDAMEIGVLTNPVGTNRHKLNEPLGEVVLAGYRVTPAETAPDPRETFARLVKLNETCDTLVIASGDGTLQQLGAQALESGIEFKRMIAFGAGNANDFAHSTHNDTRSLLRIIEQGEVRDIHPLQVTIEQPDSEEPLTHFALSYFGIGVSGKIIDVINNSRGKWWRKHDVIRHTCDTGHTFWEFFIKNQLSEQDLFSATMRGSDRHDDYVDIDVLWGDYFLRTPHDGADILDPQKAKVMAFRKDYVNLRTIGQLASGKFGTVLPPEAADIEELGSRNNNLRAHFDGEVRKIAEGSSVKFEKSAQSLPFVVIPKTSQP